MTASGRTPVGGPQSDPLTDSESGLPRTYVRTDGDELVTRDIEALESNARARNDCIHVSLSVDDFRFITTYDPERERSASRRDMVAVVEEIQTILLDGLSKCPRCYPSEMRTA